MVNFGLVSDCDLLDWSRSSLQREGVVMKRVVLPLAFVAVGMLIVHVLNALPSAGGTGVMSASVVIVTSNKGPSEEEL